MQTKTTTLLTFWILLGFMVQAQSSKMTSIFNGHNFDGWEVPENNIWWSAKDGILAVENGPNRKGSTLWTTKKYKNFIVQADFKMGKGKVDSGIFIKGNSPQVQIGISGSLKRDMTGSPYVPGKGYPQEAKGVKDLLSMNDWNTMKVKAKGNKLIVWLNGKKVLTYTVEKIEAKGPIGLQLHPKNEMSIEYRNIMVKEL